MEKWYRYVRASNHCGCQCLGVEPKLETRWAGQTYPPKCGLMIDVDVVPARTLKPKSVGDLYGDMRYENLLRAWRYAGIYRVKWVGLTPSDAV